jgi:7-keto-8-aminopelargonate synthetase-like enzyme
MQLLVSSLEIPTAPSAIIPLILGSEERAMAGATLLSDAGFFVPAIRYPTVPRQTARLRITLSAAHEPDQIRELAAALAVSSAD